MKGGEGEGVQIGEARGEVWESAGRYSKAWEVRDELKERRGGGRGTL